MIYDFHPSNWYSLGGPSSLPRAESDAEQGSTKWCTNLGLNPGHLALSRMGYPLNQPFRPSVNVQHNAKTSNVNFKQNDHCTETTDAFQLLLAPSPSYMICLLRSNNDKLITQFVMMLLWWLLSEHAPINRRMYTEIKVCDCLVE